MGQAATIFGVAVVGVADDLGYGDGIILEQVSQDLPVTGRGGRCLSRYQQVGVHVDADVKFVAVVAIPAGSVAVAGVGIHRGDDSLRRHPLRNAYPARPILFDILGRHHRQQLHLGHQPGITDPGAGNNHPAGVGKQLVTSAWRSAADAQQISGLPSRS